MPKYQPAAARQPFQRAVQHRIVARVDDQPEGGQGLARAIASL
jgi:hypothetical protein